MSKWTAKYDDGQRQAIVRTFCDVGIRSPARLAAMAAAGELRAEANSEPVPAFEIPPSSAYSIARAGERRKAGKQLAPDLARQPARDRAHALQLRLTAIIDRELERIEKRQLRGKGQPVDGEEIRKLVRALRELATLPDPSDMRLPRTPGQRGADGEKQDGPTRDSLAGRLLAASDASASPAARAQTPREDDDTRINGQATSHNNRDDDHDTREQADDAHNDHAEHNDDDDAPCSAPRAQVSGLEASGVVVAPAA